MLRYFLIYKPYGVLSQFTREAPGQKTLADFYPFPKDVYPVGRLDKDSEGLLLLTNDKKLNARLLHPHNRHPRSYLVQVEGTPLSSDLERLRKGVSIRINKKSYQTLPAKVHSVEAYPDIPPRTPPVRYRKNVPTSFQQISLIEGKNRQVRKMFAHIGFPVLRLIRIGIQDLVLRDLKNQPVREFAQKELFGKLFSP